MPGRISQSSNALLVVILLAVSYCVVFISMRLYPFVDLPNHLAAATIFRYYDDPSNAFADFFSLSLHIRPNISHFLFCGLNIFPSVEFANRIYFCLYIVLLPLTTFLCIKKIKGNTWFSLLAFFLVFNFNVTYGFTGFTFSIPFVLLFFYCLLDYREKITPLSFCAVSGMLVLLFFLHVLAMFFALLFLAFCRLYDYWRKPCHVWKDVCAVVPIALLVCFWVSTSKSSSGSGVFAFLWDYYLNGYIKTFSMRGCLVFLDNFSLYEGYPGYLIATFFSLCIAAPVAFSALTRSRSFSSRFFASYYHVPIFVFSSLVLFLFLPQDIPDVVHLFYHRFPVFFFLGLILAGSQMTPAGFRRLIPSFFFVTVLLHLFLWGGYLRDFQRENACFTPDFFSAESGSGKLGGMIFDYRFRGRSVYVHFPDYYIVWKQGVSSTFFIDSGFGSFGSTTRNVPSAVLPVYNQWIGKSGKLDDRYAGMDYLLTRGAAPQDSRNVFENFNVLKSECGWQLYGRRAQAGKRTNE